LAFIHKCYDKMRRNALKALCYLEMLSSGIIDTDFWVIECGVEGAGLIMLTIWLVRMQSHKHAISSELNVLYKSRLQFAQYNERHKNKLCVTDKRILADDLINCEYQLISSLGRYWNNDVRLLICNTVTNAIIRQFVFICTPVRFLFKIWLHNMLRLEQPLRYQSHIIIIIIIIIIIVIFTASVFIYFMAGQYSTECWNSKVSCQWEPKLCSMTKQTSQNI
jgi:hypothetical protein